MHNRQSGDNARGGRPTLPSIRDLFPSESTNLIYFTRIQLLIIDELSMSAVSHDGHRIGSQGNDVEDRSFPYGHEHTMPMAYQVNIKSIVF